MSETKPPRFCPNCGAQNPMSLPRCATCGQPLTRRDDHARFWGSDDEPTENEESNIIDLYPTIGSSSSATTASDPTVPIQLGGRPPMDAPAKPVDPWSSAGSRLSRPAVGMASAAPPVTDAPPATAKEPAPATKPKGPPGFLLGCLAFLVIFAVAVAFAWFAAQSQVSSWVSDELANGIAAELDAVDAWPVRSGGVVVLTEDQINEELARNADRLSPLSNATVRITEDGFLASGTVFRVESSVTGNLVLTNGRVAVEDLEVSGTAARLIDAEQLAERFERELAALFRRLNLQPNALEMRDGSIVISTTATT